jgi:hypothetical protein
LEDLEVFVAMAGVIEDAGFRKVGDWFILLFLPFG